MIRRSIVLLVLATMVAVAACSSASVHPHQEISDDVPAKIDPGAHYLFHMHGWVVERMGPAAAVSTGYWWRWTVEALADRGFVVISEARSSGTDVQAYALTVARHPPFTSLDACDVAERAYVAQGLAPARLPSLLEPL